MADGNDKNKKGFSGLSYLASNVSGIDEPVTPEPKAEAKPSTPKQPAQPQQGAAPSEPERKTTSSRSPVEAVSSGKSGGGSGDKLIIVIFVIWLIISVILLINSGGYQINKKPSYSPLSSSQNYSYPQSTPAPAVQTLSTTQSAGLQYTKPSVGTSTAPNKPNAQYTREAQQILTDFGYDPGPVDGDYGRRTAAAVKAFQRDVGLTQDGWIDHDLLSTLRMIRKKLLKTKAESVDSPARSQFFAPTTKPSEQPAVASRDTIAASERAQIKIYCERVTSTTGDKNNCIERALRALR